MIPILIILFCILILDCFINRSVMKKMNIEESEPENKYVNNLHKYGERILHWATMIVMIISMMDFHHLMLFIFIGAAIMFAFRTFMEWNFAKQNKTYLLSAVSCGLFIIGSIVYRLYDVII